MDSTTEKLKLEIINYFARSISDTDMIKAKAFMIDIIDDSIKAIINAKKHYLEFLPSIPKVKTIDEAFDSFLEICLKHDDMNGPVFLEDGWFDDPSSELNCSAPDGIGKNPSLC